MTAAHLLFFYFLFCADQKHGFEPRDANDGVSVEGGAEDNVSTESGGQLAEEWADSNRESTLGRSRLRPVSNLMFA